MTTMIDDALPVWSNAISILDTPYSYLGGYSLLEILVFFVFTSIIISFIWRMIDKKAGEGRTPSYGESSGEYALAANNEGLTMAQFDEKFGGYTGTQTMMTEDWEFTQSRDQADKEWNWEREGEE